MKSFPRIGFLNSNYLTVMGIAILMSLGTGVLLYFYSLEYAVSFVFLGLAGFLIFLHPYIGLLAYLVLNYLRISENYPTLAAWHLTRVVVFSLLIIWLIRKGLAKERTFVYCKQQNVLLGLIIVMLLSMLNTTWVTASYEAVIGFLKTAIIFFLVINLVDTRRKLVWFLGTLLVLHAILSMIVIPDFILRGSSAGQQRLGGAITYGLGGFLGDSNDFSLSLNIMIPFGYFLSFGQFQIKTKFATIPMLVLFLLGIILTYSRGGFVTLVATLFTLATLGKRKFQTIFFLLIIITLILPFIPQDYWSRQKTITSYDTDESVQGRFDAWKAGLKMVVAHPIVGTGMGVFLDTYPFYMPTNTSSAAWRVAHNGYIHIAGELGLLGLFLYLYLMYLTFRDNFEIHKQFKHANNNEMSLLLISKALVGGLIAFMVGSIFLSVCYYDHLYLIAALTVATKRIVNLEMTQAVVKGNMETIS